MLTKVYVGILGFQIAIRLYGLGCIWSVGENFQVSVVLIPEEDFETFSKLVDEEWEKLPTT